MSGALETVPEFAYEPASIANRETTMTWTLNIPGLLRGA
jgi:hypothetical protein